MSDGCHRPLGCARTAQCVCGLFVQTSIQEALEHPEDFEIIPDDEPSLEDYPTRPPVRIVDGVRDTESR